MSLFDDIIVNTGAALGAVGQIASEVVDKSKVKISSTELKAKINKEFEKLGRYIYDTDSAGTTDENVVKGYINNISVLISELKSLQDSLTSDNVRMVCPKCCTKNSVDSLFCKKCGTSLDYAKSYTAASDEQVTLQKEEPAADVSDDET